MTRSTRWTTLLTACAASLLLGGCDPDDRILGGDDDDTGGDDDDSAGTAFSCPYDWDGIPTGIPRDEWAAIGLMAEGNADFSLLQRNFHGYSLRWVTWDEDEENPEASQYVSSYDTPMCFRDAAGLYRGSEALYGDVLYSVSASLDDDVSWYGTIQAIPLDGSDPFPLGAVGTLRGLDLEGDDIGGFVVCGCTDPERDDEWVIWLDEEGGIVEEYEMPEGSCYDLAQADDGTYWVVSPDAELVWNLDIDTGTWTAIGSVPPPTDWGNEAWVVEQYDADTLLLAGDVNGWGAVYTMDIATGETAFLSNKSDNVWDTEGSFVTNIHYHGASGLTIVSQVERNYPSASFQGPCLSQVFDIGPGTDQSYNRLGWYGNDFGELIVDFYVIDLTLALQ